METEENGSLLFLDVVVSKKPDSLLGHTVYRKHTHADRYLNKNSSHHPKQKRGVLNTLLERAKKIWELDSLKIELEALEKVLRVISNRYSTT